jgi:hypothetical protein
MMVNLQSCFKESGFWTLSIVQADEWTYTFENGHTVHRNKSCFFKFFKF